MPTHRYLPVIPRDFTASMPERQAENAPRLRVIRPEAPHCDHAPTGPYSRTMSASAFSMIAAAVLMGSGAFSASLASLGFQELIWWVWGAPIMAGSLVSYGMVLQWSKRDDESKRKTRGRALFGLLVAISLPRLGIHFHPALVSILNDPWILFGVGGSIFLLGFGAAVGVMKFIEKRAGDIAYDQLDKYAKDKLPKHTENLKP